MFFTYMHINRRKGSNKFAYMQIKLQNYRNFSRYRYSRLQYSAKVIVSDIGDVAALDADAYHRMLPVNGGIHLGHWLIAKGLTLSVLGFTFTFGKAQRFVHTEVSVVAWQKA